MAMNEIDIILKKNPSINKEDLLILASWLLEYCDNKCPKSIASFRENIDKLRVVTIPLPHYFFIKHRDISKSDEFFNLLHKVENYSYDKDNFHIEGIKIINGEILQEWSQEIPEEDGGPIIDDFPRI